MQDRDMHLKKCQAKLNEWRDFIDDLRARAPGMSDEQQAHMQDAIAAMERTIEAGDECVAETRTIEGGAWESAKDDAAAAWNMIEEAFEKNREATSFSSQ